MLDAKNEKKNVKNNQYFFSVYIEKYLPTEVSKFPIQTGKKSWLFTMIFSLLASKTIDAIEYRLI